MVVLSAGQPGPAGLAVAVTEQQITRRVALVLLTQAAAEVAAVTVPVKVALVALVALV